MPYKRAAVVPANDRHFNYAASAQLVINPFVDQVVTANQEACRLFGSSLQELCESCASALFAPSFPTLVVFTQEVLGNGRAWSDRLLILHGGDEVRVEVTARCVAAGEEQHLYLTLQLADQLLRARERSDAERHFLSGIGHWNRVSQVFQEFERENQLLLDAAGEGIYGVDVNGMTTFVNPAAERILGYSAEELAGRNMHSMVHHRHGDGGHYPVDECPIFAVLKDGTVHTVDDDVFWSKSGKRVDVEYTSTPVRDNGFIVGAVVIFRDVSQKKADKKQLLAALTEVEQLKNRLEMENAYLQEEISSEFNHHQMIGKSAAVKQIMQKIELVAPTEATVLINGESGTGKELIARAIHDNSDRSHRSLIRVNCAAIPEELFESEFFGHTRGAFTGATADRPGRFELADGGTLFLDEVGEIPLRLQGKLLRVLQEQQFERVGESITRRVDVRIVAATNRDLTQRVAEGQFREDLYFRLNVFPIESMPLRKRLDDIPLLTQHFLTRASARANKSGLKIPLSEIEKLKRYHWPGNIRELENVIERQVILARGETLRFDMSSTTADSAEPSLAPTESSVLTEQEMREHERRNLVAALEACRGRVFGQDGAAALLGLPATTLSSRLKKFKLDPLLFRGAERAGYK
ncbi:sigma 54-interacting transcriptional regulator [Litorivivens sp.]|uniref:sigma 54-interacting transcriptional regulator n=1 Tax=Litorivivens sp. TaxID=2020868 RepID=UPI00356458FA